MIVCVCNGISDKEIIDAVARGVCTRSALRQELGVSANCGSCAKSIQALLDKVSDSNSRVISQLDFKSILLSAG